MVSIYVLRLLRGKFYVGKSSNPVKRVKQHFKYKGSAWTKKYHPIEIVDIYNNCDNFDEDKYTKMYMSKYGIENVRGGSFSTLKLKEEEIQLLKRSIMTAEDRCYVCGEKGHFVTRCPYN